MRLKSAEYVANSVNPYQSPRSAASDLGLHCLHRIIVPNSQAELLRKIRFLAGSYDFLIQGSAAHTFLTFKILQFYC